MSRLLQIFSLKNEAGEALDLSVPALFRRVAPKINFPVAELRRFEELTDGADRLLSRKRPKN